MEQEILIEITEWNSTETYISIPLFNFHKTFKHRIDAEMWARSIFKNVKFENITHS